MIICKVIVQLNLVKYIPVRFVINNLREKFLFKNIKKFIMKKSQLRMMLQSVIFVIKLLQELET